MLRKEASARCPSSLALCSGQSERSLGRARTLRYLVLFVSCIYLFFVAKRLSAWVLPLSQGHAWLRLKKSKVHQLIILNIAKYQRPASLKADFAGSNRLNLRTEKTESFE